MMWIEEALNFMLGKNAVFFGIRIELCYVLAGTSS